MFVFKLRKKNFSPTLISLLKGPYQGKFSCFFFFLKINDFQSISKCAIHSLAQPSPAQPSHAKERQTQFPGLVRLQTCHLYTHYQSKGFTHRFSIFACNSIFTKTALNTLNIFCGFLVKRAICGTKDYCEQSVSVPL